MANRYRSRLAASGRTSRAPRRSSSARRASSSRNGSTRGRGAAAPPAPARARRRCRSAVSGRASRSSTATRPGRADAVAADGRALERREHVAAADSHAPASTSLELVQRPRDRVVRAQVRLRATVVERRRRRAVGAPQHRVRQLADGVDRRPLGAARDRAAAARARRGARVVTSAARSPRRCPGPGASLRSSRRPCARAPSTASAGARRARAARRRATRTAAARGAPGRTASPGARRGPRTRPARPSAGECRPEREPDRSTDGQTTAISSGRTSRSLTSASALLRDELERASRPGAFEEPEPSRRAARAPGYR